MPKSRGSQLLCRQKKGGAQLQTENLIVTCKMSLFSLYFVKYMVFIVWKALKKIWIILIGNIALRIFDIRGR